MAVSLTPTFKDVTLSRIQDAHAFVDCVAAEVAASAASSARDVSLKKWKSP
jgi:hypothetical protein